ncbi:hypothetical protein ACFLTP_06280 [Chloroflexota bacterium]
MEKQIKERLNVTIAIRFDQETADLLREIARGKGIGSTTLIRMWTLDRLRYLNKTTKYKINGAAS